MTLKRVLLVEDTPADQFMTETIFRRALGNVEIVIAFDGVEALEVLEKGDYHPDVILLDINMPRMNGIEFLEQYAKDFPVDVQPVVVMLTSSDQDSDKTATSAYECVRGYFLKPLRKDDVYQLEELIESLL